MSVGVAMAVTLLTFPPLQVRFGGLVRTPTAPVRSGLDLLHDQARPGHRRDPELVVLPEVHVAEHVAREIDAQPAPSQGAHGRGVRAIRAVLLDEAADDPRALPVVDRLPAAVAAEPGEVGDDDALAGRGHLRLKVVYPQERTLLAVGAHGPVHRLEDALGLLRVQPLANLGKPLRTDYRNPGSGGFPSGPGASQPALPFAFHRLRPPRVRAAFIGHGCRHPAARLAVSRKHWVPTRTHPPRRAGSRRGQGGERRSPRGRRWRRNGS